MNDRKCSLIKIAKPHVSVTNGWARMSAAVTVRDEVKDIWFEVEEPYGEYLCAERSDAYLIGLLNFAMREHCDIECEAPVGEELLYQIRTYLIPILARTGRNLYASKIFAQTDSSPIENAGAVGAGISCGVDSFHVLANYSSPPYPQLQLTHLVLNNVGSFLRGKGCAQYKWQAEASKRFCSSNSFKFVLTNSNISEALRQSHYLAHTYSDAFAVYALQKLWRTFFYGSSGDGFTASLLKDNDLHDSANYDLLSLMAFSTRNLKIYSEAWDLTRFEKMKKVISYAPSHDFLHVCLSDDGPNCGHCGKCLRTLTMLDALNALDVYRNVFDIDAYMKHHRMRMWWLCAQQMLRAGDVMTRPTYVAMRDRLDCVDFAGGVVYALVSWFYWKMAGIGWLRKLVFRIKGKQLDLD